jgi:hypothetical protein
MHHTTFIRIATGFSPAVADALTEPSSAPQGQLFSDPQEYYFMPGLTYHCPCYDVFHSICRQPVLQVLSGTALGYLFN